MRGMGTENERGLQEQLVDVARTRVVAGEAGVLTAFRQLVAETEPKDLRGIEADVRLDRVLASPQRLLDVVVASAERPAPQWLNLGKQVVAEACERAMASERDGRVWELGIRGRYVRQLDVR